MPLFSNTYFGTNDQDLLLKACLLPGEEAREFWEEWVSRVDFEAPMDDGSFRLLPLLFQTLRSTGTRHPVMDRLKGIYRRAWYYNQKLFFETAKILRLFHEAGIPTILLKGSALAITLYRNPALRPMSDIDVLVPADRVKTAMGILTGDGWYCSSLPSLEFVLEFRHAAEFMHPEGHKIDLHWHLTLEASLASSRKNYTKKLWRHTLPVTFSGVPTRILDHPEGLFHTIIHGTYTNAVSPVRWIPDAFFLSAAVSGETEWNRFVDLTASHRVTLKTLEALGYLKENFHAAVPDSVMDRLNRIPVTPAEKFIYLHSMDRPRPMIYSVAGRLPAIVEFLRMAGDETSTAKLFAGYIRYFFTLLKNTSPGQIRNYLNDTLMEKRQ